jgi:hypothetical protein
MAKRGLGWRRASGTAHTPYPFIYSRDVWDVRRFNPLGHGPKVAGPSRWAVRLAVAIIILVLGGSFVLLLAQAAQALLR